MTDGFGNMIPRTVHGKGCISYSYGYWWDSY